MAVEARTDAAHREAWHLFWRIFVSDKSRRWQALTDLGLTPMQGMAISTLEPGSPLPMSTLAERMHCDNSNITGIADRLEALGYVRRQLSPNDRRVRELALTEAGVAIRERVQEQAGEPPLGISALTEQEAEQLATLMRKAAQAQPGAL